MADDVEPLADVFHVAFDLVVFFEPRVGYEVGKTLGFRREEW